MSTNGVNNAEDADMADCDGEKVVTMMDVLQEQQDFEDDANAVLGASDEKNCTYSKGYIKRQAIYACITCCSEAKDDPTKRAGVCLACSLNCHENHELIELYTKRNFRCDCGNPKFNSHPCQYTPNKNDLNVENKYNQNFAGIYCTCHRPYPDPEITDEDEMIQCIICEDWLHALHLDAVVPGNDQYSEMICKACMDNNEFLHDYSNLAVNIIVSDDVDVTTLNSTDTEIANGGIMEDKMPLNGEITEKPANIDIDESNENTNIVKNDVNTQNQQYEAPIKDDVPNTSEDLETEQKVTEEESSQDQSKNESKEETNTETNNSTEDLEKNTTSESIVNKEEISEEVSSKNMEVMPTETTELQATAKSTEISENNTETEGETENSNKEGNQDTESMKIDQLSSNEIECTKTVSNIQPNDQLNEIMEEVKVSDEDGNKKSMVEISESNETAEKAEDELVGTETNTENNDINNDDKTVSVGDEDKSATMLNGLEENSSIKENILENPSIHNSDTKIDKLSNESVVTDQKINGDTNEELSDVPKEPTLLENGENENKINLESEEINENKRKLPTEEVIDDTLTKKPKLDDKLKCIRPNGVKRLHRGAVFWPSNFRQKLCTCSECLSMYKDLSVLFLIDAEDTVFAYETLGKERVDGRTTQYEKGLEALSSLGRIQQINALTEYNKMRDKLLDFLKSFKDRKEIVKEEDIKAFFAGMKPKREPDGVYFCR